jgi:hypothetical protein
LHARDAATRRKLPRRATRSATFCARVLVRAITREARASRDATARRAAAEAFGSTLG